MSDLDENPEDRFSHNEAHCITFTHTGVVPVLLTESVLSKLAVNPELLLSTITVNDTIDETIQLLMDLVDSRYLHIIYDWLDRQNRIVLLPSYTHAIFVPRLFEEKQRDIVFGFPSVLPSVFPSP